MNRPIPRRLSFVLFSLLLCIAMLSGRSAFAADPRPLLWRVDGAAPTYLFGTIHSAHPALNALPKAVSSALAAADHYYGELSLDAATQQQTQTLFLQPPGRTLSGEMDATRWQRAERVLKGIDPGMTMAALEPFRLWAFTVTLALLEDQLSFAGAPMMDQQLYALALAAGKRTGGLETPAEQAAVFEQLSHAEQLALLDATLDYMEQAQASGVAANADSYRIYAEGDPDQFIDLLDEQMNVPLLLKLKLERLLLRERNQRMAERIDQLLSQHPGESFFFAVGAAHFAEPGGLASLLQKRGYNVRRMAP